MRSLNKALFLDRDGVINVEKNYVYKIEDFEFIEGVFDTLKFFKDNGYLLVIITNQAGIGRGYYSEQDFQVLNQWMLNEFKKHDIFIDKVYHCPFHPTEGIGDYKNDSFNRKPNPGMLLEAKMDLNIDFENSILIGDKESDIEAGIRANIKTTCIINELQSIKSNANYVIQHITQLVDIAKSANN